MNTLIIGGTGFISGRLAEELVRRGHKVTILTRGCSPLHPALRGKATTLTADRTSSGSLENAVRGKAFDVVYDMIAYGPEESEAAARIFSGRVGRFVHCSTSSVAMVSWEIRCPVTEDQDTGPVMEHWARNPFGMDYGVLKRECETLLWRAHDERRFPVSMLRPTFVSGPGDPARRDYFWIQRILDGGPLLVPGSGDHAFQQVFVDDVARAFADLADRPGTVGKAYNITGREMFSLNEYLMALGRLLGRRPELVHMDQGAFDRLDLSTSPEGDVFPFNVRRTSVFSIDRIIRDLEYRPTPFDQYMKDTIEWWTGPDRGPSNGYVRRGEELEVIGRINGVRKTES